MTSSSHPDPANEAFWRDYLTHGSPAERVSRRIFNLFPHDPRCRMCAAPFAGIGAPVMRLIGKRQAKGNPAWCDSCYTFMSRHRGGAEVETTMLFADIRGSTSLGEKLPPAEYRRLMDRFYTAASQAVFDHDGMVDKFVGDELVAVFFPLLSGERHAAGAVKAAQALLRATGHADPGGPWVPVGAGVHTGVTWFGVVGDGAHTELTVLGDEVNTAARLASLAGAGEILVTLDAGTAAGLDPTLELELRGKQQLAEVVTLTIGP
jgi:adenylate cyclase